MTNNDKLVICNKCGSDACYEKQVSSEIKTYSCFGCGFQTNSLMKSGSEFYNEQMEILPEIYKDSKFEDKKGLIWIPSTINIPDKGMVFWSGTNKNNAKWSSVLAVEVKEEEKEKYPIKGKKGEYYKWRMDTSTTKLFEERDYISALSYIKVIP